MVIGKSQSVGPRVTAKKGKVTKRVRTLVPREFHSIDRLDYVELRPCSWGKREGNEAYMVHATETQETGGQGDNQYMVVQRRCRNTVV